MLFSHRLISSGAVGTFKLACLFLNDKDLFLVVLEAETSKTEAAADFVSGESVILVYK